MPTILNLRKLYIRNNTNSPYSPLDDRIFRAWADAAREQVAFSRLSRLHLYYHRGITKWSLYRLCDFPSLGDLTLHECNLSKQDIDIAIDQGWIEPHRYARSLDDDARMYRINLWLQIVRRRSRPAVPQKSVSKDEARWQACHTSASCS
jgi:hypothetical protein